MEHKSTRQISEKKTPLDEAISNNRNQTAEFLRKNGAKTGAELTNK